jgi:hypothetical protein
VTRTNPFLLFAVLIGTAIFCNVLAASIGQESYTLLTMGLLLAGIVLSYRRPLNDIVFWVVLTFGGRALDGGAWVLFIIMLFVYIVFDVGLVSIRRK